MHAGKPVLEILRVLAAEVEEEKREHGSRPGTKCLQTAQQLRGSITCSAFLDFKSWHSQNNGDFMIILCFDNVNLSLRCRRRAFPGLACKRYLREKAATSKIYIHCQRRSLSLCLLCLSALPILVIPFFCSLPSDSSLLQGRYLGFGLAWSLA